MSMNPLFFTWKYKRSKTLSMFSFLSFSLRSSWNLESWLKVLLCSATSVHTTLFTITSLRVPGGSRRPSKVYVYSPKSLRSRRDSKSKLSSHTWTKYLYHHSLQKLSVLRFTSFDECPVYEVLRWMYSIDFNSMCINFYLCLSSYH